MAASSRLGVLMKLDKNQRKPRVFKASDLCPYYNRRVNSSDNAGCFHISFSFSVGTPLLRCPRTPEDGCPYNNFTNYAVSICKRQEIIPQDLLFQIDVI